MGEIPASDPADARSLQPPRQNLKGLRNTSRCEHSKGSPPSSAPNQDAQDSDDKRKVSPP